MIIVYIWWIVFISLFLYVYLYNFSFLFILQLPVLRRNRERRLAEVYANRIMRRNIRDLFDAFAIPENEFVRMYRLTKNMVRAVIEELEPHIPP